MIVSARDQAQKHVDPLSETVLCAKNARYSSVAFSSMSAYAEPNRAMRTLRRITVVSRFQV